MTKKYSRIGRDGNEPPGKTVDEYGQPIPPDPVPIIMRGLYDWRAQCRRPLPPPCPPKFEDCVAWWRDQMQEPEYRGETRQMKGGDGSDDPIFWDCGYAVRCRSSLLRFLAMSDDERNFVVAARQDGIFYRGEDPQHFADVCDETIRHKEMGVEPYRKAAISSMTHAIESMLGKPSYHGQESLTGRDRPPEGSAEWYAAKTGKPLEPLTAPDRVPR